MCGTGVIADKDGKVYVLLYLALAEHHFAVTLPEVETVMASARLS